MTNRRLIPLASTAILFVVGLLAPAPLHAQGPPSAVEYYHLDALGSVRVVTNQAGAVVSRHDLMPFGEEWQPATLGREALLFTGKERDYDTGLDYFGARYYRAHVGRFTTVDPGHADATPGSPQSWNAYAYARNNPLRWVDLDGRASTDQKPGACPTDYCVTVTAPMPRDEGLMGWAYRNFYGALDFFTMATPVQAPGLGEADLPLVDRSPDTLVLVAATIVRPGRALPALKMLHPRSTLLEGTLAFWRKKATTEIIDSLKPGLREALRVRPDGTVLNGHHRLLILQERGVNINALPREVIPR